jgi:hypothetical protein
MRQLKIENPTLRKENRLYNMSLLTEVCDLRYYDMIYVYHKIKTGEELELRRDLMALFNPYAIEVVYKGYKLGYVSERNSRMIAMQMDQGKKVKCQVNRTAFNPHNPMSGLDIEIKYEGF